MNFLSLIFPQTVYKTTSKFSGEIKVVDHAFTRRLIVGGLTQSGGILYSMWKEEMRVLSSKYYVSGIKNVLVLGLGAGTVAQVISKKWPDAKIVGVEIDSAMIDIGKKYFGLVVVKNIKIIIGDAIKLVNNLTMQQSNNIFFDLIIVDLYKGYEMEKRLQNITFLQKLGQILAKNGLVIFNVISSQNANFEASVFLDKLHRIFKDNFCRRILTNTFFFCANAITKGGELSMAKKKRRKKR